MTDSKQLLSRLDDYTSGTMPEDEALTFEEELFGAAAESDDVISFFDRLAPLSAYVAARGGFDGGATREQVDALLASGARIEYIDFGPSGHLEVSEWPAETEIVIIRLGVDLRGYGDIDVITEAPDGRLIKVFRDVRCDPHEGALYAVCEESLARKAFLAGSITARVTAVRGGERETVGVYHSRPTRAQ